MFGHDISGYGTGFDEKSYSSADLVVLYKRDIDQVKNPIFYQINTSHIHTPTNNTGIISSELEIKANILNQEVKINNLRLRMFWVRHNQKWLIEHMHISLPTDAHEGDEAYPIKELEEQNKVLQRLVDERTRELNNAIVEISKLAITDKLTKLFNRLKIEESLENELHRSRRYHNIFSIIFIDIDYFKSVNDVFGHLAGDRVLVEISRIISERIRKTDICGRWGGEEFIIICPETTLSEAADLAETIRQKIEVHNFDNIGFKTASFGVTEYKENDTIDIIVNRADEALYRAKFKGRNQVFSI